jgi:hypothetical protein
MLFNSRMVNMQHLWNPSTEYLGKKTDKPNYFITVVTAKTRQNWWEEPLLAPAWAAYDQLLQKSGMTPQMITEWPIKDGDMPPEPGKAPSEWAKGHWILGGSSSSPIKAEIVQNSNVALLPAKVGVKPGDYVALGCSAAIKQNNPRALKHFCNSVLFTAPGEEIAVGNSVSGAELMRSAQAQGLNPVGFGAPSQQYGDFRTAAGPGGASMPQGGPGFPHGGNAAPQPGFVPPNGPGGFAPTPAIPATAYPSSQPQQPGGYPGGGFNQPGPGAFPGR